MEGGWGWRRRSGSSLQNSQSAPHPQILFSPLPPPTPKTIPRSPKDGRSPQFLGSDGSFLLTFLELNIKLRSMIDLSSQFFFLWVHGHRKPFSVWSGGRNTSAFFRKIPVSGQLGHTLQAQKKVSILSLNCTFHAKHQSTGDSRPLILAMNPM